MRCGWLLLFLSVLCRDNDKNYRDREIYGEREDLTYAIINDCLIERKPLTPHDWGGGERGVE